MKLGDRNDSRFQRIHIPGHDRLERVNDLGADDQRVDRLVRLGCVAAMPFQFD